MRPDAAPADRAAALARGHDGDPDRHGEGLLPAAPDGGLDTAARRGRADLAATAAAEPDLVTVVGTAGRLAGGPVPGRRCADRRRVCDNTGRQRRRAGRRRSGSFVAASAWARPRRGARLARRRRSVSRTPIVDRIVPATTAADRDAAAAALGVRDEMAVVGEPLPAVGAARTPSSPPGRRWELDGALVVAGRRALPADEAAPAQRLALGDGLPRGGRGLRDRRRRAGDRVGRAAGPRASAPRSRRPCPTPGSTRSGTSTTWSTGSATPPCDHLLRQIGSDGSLKIPERWFARAAGAARRRGRRTPVLELALAGWVAATRPDRAGGRSTARRPGRGGARTAAGRTPDPRAVVAALLRTVGATDLAEQADLSRPSPPGSRQLRAGQIEL